MLKLRNRKGFTLAELLIVVAIIGVLAAISIPIFTAQLEKSRESVDQANIRDAYAVLVAAYLTEDAGIVDGSTDRITYSATAASGGTAFTASATVTPAQTVAGWQTHNGEDDMEIAGVDVNAKTSGTWSITIDGETGKATIG